MYVEPGGKMLFRRPARLFLLLCTALSLYTYLHLMLWSSDHGDMTFTEHNKGSFHIVSSFPYLLGNRKYREMMGYGNYSKDELVVRQQEFLETLIENINNSVVGSVRLMIETEEAVEYIKSQNLKHIEKIIFHRIQSNHTYKEAFTYANDNLFGKFVIFMNGDIVLGDGFEKLDLRRLLVTRTAYALTRHADHLHRCDMDNFCLKANYIGSHDVFVFHLKPKIEEKTLSVLDFPTNSHGAENVLIDILRSDMKYTVLNPCYVLKLCQNNRYYKAMELKRSHNLDLEDMRITKRSQSSQPLMYVYVTQT
ncbi:unnamed protein product [Owenia fusiformis]|uniref:Uncharacterized protein n=1 Tax=Owenia fusiformis TaxID=6347 RepID=A0A8S4NXY1_OWEFU|nr:unnamed protein product [Owenia fusiformis]